MEITARVFETENCKQQKKQFIYEHKDIYVIFMLIKSNYSDCYFIDFNCSIKALHQKFIISEENYDIVLQPRITLLSGVTQLKFEEMDKEKYEKILLETITDILHKVNKEGLVFVKKLEKEGYVLEKKAKEYLSSL